MKSKSKGFKVILKYPDFIKIWLGRLISRLGDSIDTIAFMWMIYELTDSSILMGTIMTVNFLPNVVFGLFSGVFVDRWKKKPVMITGDLGRGLCVTITAVLYITGTVEPWHLYLITFINSTFETFASAARGAVIPRLVKEEEDYLTANSLFNASSSFAQMVGLGSAGFIIGMFGIGTAILIDAITFFICAIFMMVTRIPVIEKEKKKTKLTAENFSFDFKEGLSTAFKTPLIRISIILGISLNLFISPFNVLAPLYADNILGGGAKTYSFLTLGLTGGMLVGSLVIGQIGNNFSFKKLISSGVFLMALGFSGFYLTLNITVALIFALLIGLGSAALSSSISSLVMKTTPKEIMGRISSVMNSLMMAAMPASTAIAGLIAEYYSTDFIFMIMGSAIFIIGIFVVFNQTLSNISEAKEKTEVVT